MTKIKWEIKAINFLKKIDKINSKRIIKKIEEISNNVKRYIEPLKDIEEDKIRVGKFRLFVKYDEKEDVLKIYTIKHRKNAYKK